MSQNQERDRETMETSFTIGNNVNQSGISHNHPPSLHWAAYFGDLNKVNELLNGTNPGSREPVTRSLDEAKMTPLHLAAHGANPQSEDISSRLVEVDKADPLSKEKEPLVNLQDDKGKTPLHYAAAARHPKLVILLLHKFGANPNVKDYGGSTPVDISAEGNSDGAIECVRIFLTASSIPGDPFDPRSSCWNLLYIAASKTASRMLTFLLEGPGKGFKHSERDSQGFTLLMAATCAGDSECAVKCVEALLKVLTEEEINAKSSNQDQTAVMMAAFHAHEKVLNALVKDLRTDVFLTDSQHQRTALHWAVEAWFRPNSLACVKLLVKSDQMSLDKEYMKRFLFWKKDINDNAPIDIAVNNRSIPIITYFVTADSTPEAWLTNEMLMKIYKTFPEVIIPLMNKALRYNPATFHEGETISVEFGTILGFQVPDDKDKPNQETKHLNQIIRAPKEIQNKIFLHPLVQIFFDLKWKKFRCLTWMGILFQFIWIAIYTFMIFEIYVPNCPDENAHNNKQFHWKYDHRERKKTPKLFLSLWFAQREDSNLTDCDFNHGAAQVFACILYALSILVLAKEAFQALVLTNNRYFKQPTNYVQLLILLISVMNSSPAWQSSSDVNEWHSFLAAVFMKYYKHRAMKRIGIFISWVLILKEVEKFPRCGIYCNILKKVFWHCLKMMVFYLPILIAFVRLRILVPGKGQYTYFIFAIIKVVIMMTGELEFEDAFYGDENDGPSVEWNTILGQIFFLVFVFTTTIVLLNLLIGLAVNDVQVLTLLQDAQISKLYNELEQIFLWESLIHWASPKQARKYNIIKSNENSKFSSLVEKVETKTYSVELRKDIKYIMIPVVETG